ncbi:MAG: tetratricopeptide (TPR) repeat protein [Arenicella sp.]|jgi:tetratricopeptide (TPR) repeat protein
MKEKLRKYQFQIIIFVFSFFLYSNTISNDFAWDDKIVITENNRVQQGVSNIPNLFLKYNTGLRQDKYGYRPITLSTFALDYTLFGDNPRGFHFMSVLYFSLLCLILYMLLRRVFNEYNHLLAFVITILFAAHPLHVEVVANIKSRDEILALMFALLSLYFFLEFYFKKKWLYLISSAALFFIAFLSKENAFTFLAILPLAVVVQKDWNWKNLLKASFILPFLGALAVFILNRAINSNLGVEETLNLSLYEESHLLGNSFFEVNRVGIKFANAFHLIFLYLKNFFVPHPLTYYSGFSHIEVLEFHWKPIAGALISLGALFFSVFRMKKYPVISFGILFFFITLSVYLHFYRNLADTMADRFAFIPSLGLCIALVGLLATLLKIPLLKDEKGDAKKVKVSITKQLNVRVKVSGVVILLALCVLTTKRNKVWQDDFTLVSTDMPNLENCSRAHYFFASLLNEKILTEGWELGIEQEMILHYERSIEISDEIYYGRLELGSYLCNKGQFEEGISVFEDATLKFSKNSDPHFYLGQAYFIEGRFQDAVEELESALSIAPGYMDTYHLLALSYAKIGKFEEALFTSKDRLEKFPGNELTYFEELGNIYFDKGDINQSTDNTFEMIDHGGDPYTVYATVIGRYQTIGDDESAAFYYQRAISLGIMQSQ